MSIRRRIAKLIYNYDKVVDEKVKERLDRYNGSKINNDLMIYRQKENKAWASSNGDVIAEFYTKTNLPATYTSNRYLFWKYANNLDIPKTHYPAPNSLLNSQKSLLFGTLPDMYFDTEIDTERTTIDLLNERLDEILEDNNIAELLQNGAILESYSGGVGFKFNVDEKISKKPIIELYPQERIELTSKYNRITEIIFLDYYMVDRKQYTLKSIYGKGYIDYILLNDKNKEVPLGTIQELADLERIEFNTNELMAVFKKNRTDNIEFKDSVYGGSDFQGNIDLFHMIDETNSNMLHAIRLSRPILSISETMLRTSPDGGKHKIPKTYEHDLTILKKDQDAKNIQNFIHRDFVDLKIQEYLETIKALQKAVFQNVGMSNVSTNLEAIGANQSGVALQELEKSTVILYQNKSRLWQEALSKVIRLSLMYEDFIKVGAIKDDYKEYNLNINFADYHSETMADRIETYTKAYQGLAFDLETFHEEIHANRYNEEKIKRITRNVKIEQGIPILQDQLDDEVGE